MKAKLFSAFSAIGLGLGLLMFQGAAKADPWVGVATTTGNGFTDANLQVDLSTPLSSSIGLRSTVSESGVKVVPVYEYEINDVTLFGGLGLGVDTENSVNLVSRVGAQVELGGPSVIYSQFDYTDAADDDDISFAAGYGYKF